VTTVPPPAALLLRTGRGLPADDVRRQLGGVHGVVGGGTRRRRQHTTRSNSDRRAALGRSGEDREGYVEEAATILTVLHARGGEMTSGAIGAVRLLLADDPSTCGFWRMPDWLRSRFVAESVYTGCRSSACKPLSVAGLTGWSRRGRSLAVIFGAVILRVAPLPLLWPNRCARPATAGGNDDVNDRT
jgi:hypothetical protein